MWFVAKCQAEIRAEGKKSDAKWYAEIDWNDKVGETIKRVEMIQSVSVEMAVILFVSSIILLFHQNRNICTARANEVLFD